MKHCAILLCLLLPCAARPHPVAAQEAAGLRGSFTVNRQAGDDVNRAIDDAVARMSFVTRPVTRARLRKTNMVYDRVAVAQNGQRVSVRFGDRPPMESPANGAPVKWTSGDGEKFDLSTEWEGGKLVQTLKAKDGERTNTFAVSPDGRTLTLAVVVRSPRLPKPLEYKLVYNRAD